jgi:hypothetical protein
MVNAEVALGHNLLQVSISERVSQIPANAQEDDHVFEMPPTKQYRPFLGHDTTYQIRSTAFATEPVCRARRQKDGVASLRTPTEKDSLRAIFDIAEWRGNCFGC